MKKPLYALLLILGLFLASPSFAQEMDALSPLNEKITNLENTLETARETFTALESSMAGSPELGENRMILATAETNLTELKAERDTLAGEAVTEETSLAIQTLEGKANALEMTLATVQTSLSSQAQTSTQIASTSTSPAVEIDVIPYVYQEADKGFILEVKLPDAEGTDEVKAISQAWIDHSNNRMEAVKKQGTDWNKQKPSAPQYVWLTNYNEYRNAELGVTSLVVNFYEYTGNLPGREETQVSLIKEDGMLVKALDLLSPSQVAYVQTTLDSQLKEDLSRPASDLDKKHMNGQKVDLSKGAIFFTEDTLEVQFPTGTLNSELGRPAVLSLPLDEILAH